MGKKNDGSEKHEDFDYTKCTHGSTVILAGRRVCNSGCGKDLGPA